VELIGMEACGGSHFLGRALREQGHDVRLIPAQYVKSYVKSNKSDYIDAEAIAEAVGHTRGPLWPRIWVGYLYVML
jgi:transposase